MTATEKDGKCMTQECNFFKGTSKNHYRHADTESRSAFSASPTKMH